MLLDIQIRLVPPRSKGIPEGAIAPTAAAEQIRLTLAGRVMLVWAADSLGGLSKAKAFDDWPFLAGYGRCHELCHLVTDWRSELDPKTGQPRPAVEPGRADRMLHLLQQIASPAEHSLGQPRSSQR
ncbi:hypothetical protein ACFVTP_32875 [Streptomyces celluloflavus]|uniref:hypothetical protein n=1 Tax=Streptomyces celluloflavus TaxID=58344 RepID=UPI0036DCB1CA